MHGLEAEYTDRIDFVYLNIDDPATDPFKKQLGYAGQPHFFLLDGDGATLQAWRGRVGEEEFRTAFEAALGN